MAAKPEIRTGIDFDDEGLRLSTVRITTHCRSLDSPEVKVETLHQLRERAPKCIAAPSHYLEVIAARLPRCATRGGMATSISIPSSAQFLRCVSTSQINEAQKSIADELGGPVQCTSWQVNSQKSMLCGVRADFTESLISILGDNGYRCQSVLPRSAAIARTHLLMTRATIPNAVIVVWDRDWSLITLVQDRSIRLCREVRLDLTETTPRLSKGQADSLQSSQAMEKGDESKHARLSERAIELANEIGLTLQHAERLGQEAMVSTAPIYICGAMTSIHGAMQSVGDAVQALIGRSICNWSEFQQTGDSKLPSINGNGDTVSLALAIGGSKVGIEQLSVGGRVR